MPRGPRVELVDGIHHVMARAPSGRLLYRDADDRTVHLRLLGAEAVKRRWQVLTYCLMGNHFHLLMRTPEANLGAGMKHAQEAFATFVNEKYREHGHVFGQRFANRLVRDDRHLWGCFRYIARNPVAAGLCATPEAWPWSAHRALVGAAPAPGWLDLGTALTTFGPDPKTGQMTYARLTATEDEPLMEQLERTCDDDGWIREAVDDFGVSVDAVRSHLDVSRATVYRRLAGVRGG